jgi:Rps23 Pro-64 3,4-dihydroxylase Tpa1-like proline 4-hydroxylase
VNKGKSVNLELSQIANAIEVIGDAHGHALVRYQCRILATSHQPEHIAGALAEFSASGTANEILKSVLSLICSAEDVPPDISRPNNLAGVAEGGSLLKCLMNTDEATLILWLGQNAGRLARKIECATARVGTVCATFWSGNAIDGMMQDYRHSSGYPKEPIWFRRRSGDPECCELEEVVRGKRLIILVGERVAFWEINRLLAAAAVRGTPVLPITFCGARTRIGPLIIGGNRKPFHLSRLGERICASPEKFKAAMLVSCSDEYDGTASDMVAEEVSRLIETVPDSSCLFVSDVGPDGRIFRKPVCMAKDLLHVRLDGTMWSIRSILAQEIESDRESWAQASRQVQSGGLVAIQSAIRKDVADVMHNSLASSSQWRVYEGVHPFFFYHHHNIYDIEDMSPTMLIMSMIFSSRETIKWASEFVGADCSGPVQQSASWYMPGDHSTPHSDSALGRQLAFVWHLTSEWEPAWGGHLVWLPGDRILPVSYNTLHLFDTRKSGRHFVMQVSPRARAKRLCWNGWWTNRERGDDDAPNVESYMAFETAGGFRFYEVHRR